MPRRRRLQFEGARYHVLNRGNYRQPIFARAGAARAFEATLAEACVRHGWRLHAHVVMSNHFHLALETPQPNLAVGMHWLQSTFATRFNRYRDERGHVFQGRYQALLVEDDAHLARLIDYVHLNPVRAGLVPPEQVAAFRWSSLRRMMRPPRPTWMECGTLLAQHGLRDTVDDWAHYATWLSALGGDTAAQERVGFEAFDRGWAIGTWAWRRAVSADHVLETRRGPLSLESRELKELHWQEQLASALAARGKTTTDLAADRKAAPWKVELARALRQRAGAPPRWLASALHMGGAASVRVYLCRKINE